MTTAPVEKTVTYATTVPTVQAAFGFVMEHLDEFAEPHIEIRPRRWTDASIPAMAMGEEGNWHLDFEVTIRGTMEVRINV